MNELFSDAKSWVLWLLGSAMTIGAWAFKRHVKRIDDLEKAMVTRDEFERVIDNMSDERLRMHAENRETLNRIDERVYDLLERRQ